MNQIKKILFALVIIAGLGLLVACNNPRKKFNEFKKSDKFKVVATTTMLTDLANQLGKDKVLVHSLMAPGVDPHTYNANSLDVEYLEAADLVIVSGLHLEAQMGQAIKKLGNKVVDASSVLVAKHDAGEIVLREWTDPDDVEAAKKDGIDKLYDPHFWFNVEYWQLITDNVANKMVELNQANKDFYLKNATAYKEELAKANEYVKGRVAELEEAERILFTAHDAFGYFGEYYNFQVEAVQGISTETEANSGDIDALVKTAMEKKIKVVFIETSIPKKTMESVVETAKSKGYTLIIAEKELYSDSLGDESDGVTTYIKMIKANIDNIVDSIKSAR